MIQRHLNQIADGSVWETNLGMAGRLSSPSPFRLFIRSSFLPIEATSAMGQTRPPVEASDLLNHCTFHSFLIGPASLTKPNS